MKAFQTSKNDRGANMVEYGLMVAVIALVALAAVTLLGEKGDETFTTIAAGFEDDGSTAGPGNSNGGSNESDDPGNSGSGGNGGNTSGGQDQGGNHDENQGGNQGGNQGNDEGQNPGGNGGQQEPLDNDDEGQDPGDDDQNPGGDGGSDGGSGDDVKDEEEVREVYPGVSNVNSRVLWQNQREGAWEGLATYRNDTGSDQELTLKITQIDDQGVEKVNTYKLYVHAKSSKEYSTNYHLTNRLQKGENPSGVIEVRIEVESIRTHTNWEYYTYEVDDSPVVVKAPKFG